MRISLNYRINFLSSNFDILKFELHKWFLNSFVIGREFKNRNTIKALKPLPLFMKYKIATLSSSDENTNFLKILQPIDNTCRNVKTSYEKYQKRKKNMTAIWLTGEPGHKWFTSNLQADPFVCRQPATGSCMETKPSSYLNLNIGWGLLKKYAFFSVYVQRKGDFSEKPGKDLRCSYFSPKYYLKVKSYRSLSAYYSWSS